MTTITKRTSAWIQTYSGNTFHFNEPECKEIRISDIAHSLALQCRFGGHCKEFYSVAEHSVRVSRYIQKCPNTTPNDIMWGLLHDATEAYLTDIPRPLKRSSRWGMAYRDMENKIMDIIIRRFGLFSLEPDIVEQADRVLIATEVRDLMKECKVSWEDLSSIEPLEEKIVPWCWREAENAFMNEFISNFL